MKSDMPERSFRESLAHIKSFILHIIMYYRLFCTYTCIQSLARSQCHICHRMGTQGGSDTDVIKTIKTCISRHFMYFMYFDVYHVKWSRIMPIRRGLVRPLVFLTFSAVSWIMDDLAHTQLHAIYTYDGKRVIWLFEKESAKSAR